MWYRVYDVTRDFQDQPENKWEQTANVNKYLKKKKKKKYT